MLPYGTDLQSQKQDGTAKGSVLLLKPSSARREMGFILERVLLCLGLSNAFEVAIRYRCCWSRCTYCCRLWQVTSVAPNGHRLLKGANWANVFVLRSAAAWCRRSVDARCQSDGLRVLQAVWCTDHGYLSGTWRLLAWVLSGRRSAGDTVWVAADANSRLV